MGKVMGPACSNKCFHKCKENISDEIRKEIHTNFWAMSSDEKKVFYAQYIKQSDIKRRRTESKENSNPKKKYTFKFFFNVNTRILQVCKKYFLNTLAITDRTVYYFFEKRYKEVDGSEKQSKTVNRGRKPIEESRITEVKNHISSFPTIDSHYCRSSTTRKYLEAHLSVQKMYDLYKTFSTNPVTVDMYRNIFNTNFNLSFHVPKKDVCDKCSLFKINEKSYNDSEKEIYKLHVEEKKFTRAERGVDLNNIDNNHAILLYDLQNVITLPKMFASTFYYKRKLCVYNLTATLKLPGCDKKTYCAIWNESISGRSGNDIASALMKILEQILNDHSNIKRLILWSDSCVPQNRNKITSTAIMKFLFDHPQVEYIAQKFGEPGHSSLQEVDCIHSVIEKYTRNLEIPSEITLLRLLNNMNYPNVHLVVLQMEQQDFKNYAYKSSSLEFKEIQYFKTKSLLYKNNDFFNIFVKRSFKESNYKKINIKKSKSNFRDPLSFWNEALRRAPVKSLDKNKQTDLKSMIIFFGRQEDRDFYTKMCL